MKQAVWFSIYSKKKDQLLWDRVEELYQKAKTDTGTELIPDNQGMEFGTAEKFGKEFRQQEGVIYYPTLIFRDKNRKELSRITCNMNDKVIYDRFVLHLNGGSMKQPIGDFPRNIPCILKKYWYVPLALTVAIIVYLKYKP